MSDPVAGELDPAVLDRIAKKLARARALRTLADLRKQERISYADELIICRAIEVSGDDVCDHERPRGAP